MRRMELNQNLENQTRLEATAQYAKFWDDRFNKCLKEGAPDLHVCRTRTIKNLNDPQERERAKEANDQFVKCAQAVIDQYVDWKTVKTVVDVSCGPGHFLKWLVAKKIPQVHGMDVSQGVVDYMRKHLIEKKEYGRLLHIMMAPAHHILKAQGRHTGFGPGKVDIVLLIRAGLHLPPEEWDEFMVGAPQVLAPGGVLIVGEFFRDRWDERRGQNEGTWYRYKKDYEAALPELALVHEAGPCIFDEDPCDFLFFRKPFPPDNNS